uniref:Dynein axonemal assembly factor 9 n=1 Tax=Lates calcarifer TaxID=8187 RepID=A0A4W6C4D3_LATCA
MAGIRTVNGKFSGINPAVSCCRLRQVQSLLCEGGATTPDGILCSLGIDSRYNDGCTELAKYLFYGLYGRNQLNLDHVLDEFPEEMLDDVILLIKAECVHLYCNPLNYSYLLPYVSHWRNLHLYCMTEAEYEDEEAAEEFKISSFVTMVQDCYRIGVPYSSQGHVQKFDMFMVEKWPLIQAFALEGIGGGSFFTIKYKLMDMSEKLWQVYTRLDPVSLDSLLAEDLVNFEKQWSGFFSSMDLESHLSILELSEAQAGEAFRTYYSHGLISSNITDKSKSRQPFVLFGKHSSAEDLESYSFNFPSESHQVRNTGPQGSTARHMVLQCVAPKGPLACSRTYFFGNTHSPYLGNQNTEQKKTEVLLLSQIYSAAVQAVLSGIKCYSCSSSATKVRQKRTYSNIYLTFDCVFSCFRSKCEFSIQAVNKQGRWLSSFPLKSSPSRLILLFSKASMTVHDIPDLQGDRGDLGSVVFSESFLESSINIQQKDGTVSSDSCYTILTTTVPRYACWLVCVEQNFYFILMSKSGSEGTCLGTALTAADAAYVFSSSQLSTPEEGKIIFFSEGLLFIHSQYGSITLSKNHINTLKFYDPDSSTVASLFVEYESSLLPHLPFPLHSSDQCLVFALQPRSKSHRAFYSKVLSVWQNSESGLTLQLLDQSQLTWTQKKIGYPLDNNVEVNNVFGSYKEFLPLWHPRLIIVMLMKLISDVGFLMCVKVVITIITGLPGSHKKRLCNFLVQLNKERGRYKWVVYEPGPDSCDSFSASHLQQYLSSFLESQRGPGGKPRLLVLSPGGYTDIVFSGKRASFSWNSYSLFVPRCMSGIVSTVVFTGLTAEQKHPLMQHVQQLVRSANPTAAFILAERGAVTRNEDVNLILSESSFNEPQMLRAPLKSSLRPSPFRGNVYNVWGKVRFSDSEQLMEVSYNTVSGSLSIVSEQSIDPLTLRPKETNTSCFLIFDGIGLTEDGLKELAQTVHQMTRHLDPLPPGYFYNGYQYVDIFGEKRNFHPNMEEFIKEYIAEANKEIELFNRQLELQGQPDLFDP